MDSETIETVAAEWFAKRASERWTDEDQSNLDAWLNEATAHRVAFVRLDAAWQHSARLKALGAGVAPGTIPGRHSWRFSPLFEQKCGAPKGSVARVWRMPWKSVMAVTLVALASALGWYLTQGNAESYRTRVGRTKTIPLADGSQVTLNTDSLIRVAVTQAERRIELSHGEAFFVVAKDSLRPFVVAAGANRVVAVGTRFAVRREGEEVRVVVTEGKVRLQGNARGKLLATQLDAGAVAQTKDTAVRVQQKSTPEAEQILSWRTGYVSFRDAELSEAVAEFNRYSRRKIHIEDPQIADIRIGGNFRTDNADAFLWLLQNGFPVRIERGDDQIVLKSR
jgi:transmembrane sensor